MALKGQAALRRKLLKMTPEIRKELEIALLTGAQDIAKTAKTLVPKRTGKLMKSIGAVVGDAPSTKATQALRGRASKKDGISATAYAGDDEAYYAAWVEFGTKASAAKPSRRNRNYRRTLIMTREYKAHAATPAQPFFFPAFRLNKKRANSRTARSMRKAIKKVAQS